MGRRFNPQCRCKPFKRPSISQEVAALGDNAGVWGQLLNRSVVPSIPKPGKDDWLSVVEERGQPLTSFARLSMRARLHHTYRTLYLVPLAWDEGVAPSGMVCTAAAAYIQAFFPGLNVEMLAAVQVAAHRTHPEEGHEQILTGDAYSVLGNLRMQREIARKAVGIVGLTTTDIYPGDDWDHVAGEALPMNSVGVVSWYRGSAWDAGNSLKPSDGTPPSFALALRRFVRTLSHEITHLFGLHHCIYRHCLMNGSNHQLESDSRPGCLCTLCLRKLYFGLCERADGDEAAITWISARQHALQEWYTEHGLDDSELAALGVALL
jgi:archaemetzincin